MRRLLATGLILFSITLLSACDEGGPTGPPPPPSTGLVVQTIARLPGGAQVNNPSVVVEGCVAAFTPCPSYFNESHFRGQTGTDALLWVSNALVPEDWWFKQSASSYCNLYTISPIIHVGTPGQRVPIYCTSNSSGTVNPSSIDVRNPPPTFTVTGSYMDSRYGMPEVRFYDVFGTYQTSTTASSAAPDGTSLVAPTPPIGNLYSGTYAVVVFSVQADGSLVAMEGSTVDLFGNDPPPPPPPDPDPCPDCPPLIVMKKPVVPAPNGLKEDATARRAQLKPHRANLGFEN